MPCRTAATRRLPRVLLLLRHAFALLSCVGAALPAAAQGIDPEQALEARLAELAGAARGSVGVGVVHVQSGRSAWLRPDETFPMASTAKLPIAIQLLQRVQDGEMDLDGKVRIGRGDLHPGSGDLGEFYVEPGIERSRRWLLERMLIISDNSATDLILREAGGPAVVSRRMRELRLPGIRVDRSTLRLICDWLGVRELPPEREVDPRTFLQLYGGLSLRERTEAELAFEQDLRDTCTPRAMARLLARLRRGDLLADEQGTLLLEVMARCQTGPGRLAAGLPEGTPLAHKTGTIGRATNDVGIATLPGEAGHLVVSVFVKQSLVPVPEREQVIAALAGAAYQHFLSELTED